MLSEFVELEEFLAHCYGNLRCNLYDE